MTVKLYKVLSDNGINPDEVDTRNLGNAYQVIKGSELLGYVFTDEWTFQNKMRAK